MISFRPFRVLEANMKRNVLWMMIAAWCAVLLMSCGEGGTGQVKKTDPKASTIIEEGWINDNQFRVKTMAETDLATDDKESLRKASEALALKKAREAVVKNFVAIRMKKSANTAAGAYAVIAIAVEKEFRDIIESGKVIRKEFQNGDKICTVVFQVEKSGLKKLVEEGGDKK
jgi:hypothetical protein